MPRPMARSRPASVRSAVARDQRARDHERRRRGDERKPRIRRDLVEGMLPGERSARDQHHVVRERDHRGGADAQRRVAGVEGVCRDRESRGPSAFVRTIGPETHQGRAGERFDRNVAEREAVTGLAEYLTGAAIVVRGQAVEEPRKRDTTVRIDRMPRNGTACPQVERAPKLQPP